MSNQVTFWVMLHEERPNWTNRITAVKCGKTFKRKPKIDEPGVAVKVTIEVPDELFEIPTVELTVDPALRVVRPA